MIGLTNAWIENTIQMTNAWVGKTTGPTGERTAETRVAIVALIAGSTMGSGNV
ncbi:MAG: hypothetical protein U9N83_06435 [Thermodesulfobacteriota bacterium]|nr:hypothetical protein [Thermodesulfobacteriota bacterium]